MSNKQGTVWITQYKRPHGEKERVYCRVSLETMLKAENMRLSTELLTTGKVAIYARFNDEEEEKERIELADNNEGDKSPGKMLEKLINTTYEERYGKGEEEEGVNN